MGAYPWYGYPYGPYGGGYYFDNSGEIRLQVTPKQAQVFVDGYLAGNVDDFDGMFQRLHVQPGNHELTLYLEGYQTVRQDIALSPNQNVKIQYAMQPVAAGEISEPPPRPAPGTAEATVQAPVELQPPAARPGRRPRRSRPGASAHSCCASSRQAPRF